MSGGLQFPFFLGRRGDIGGTGADGAFAPLTNTTITANANYTSFYIPYGVTVTVSGGSQPIAIKVAGDARVDGTLTGTGGGYPGGTRVSYGYNSSGPGPGEGPKGGVPGTTVYLGTYGATNYGGGTPGGAGGRNVSPVANYTSSPILLPGDFDPMQVSLLPGSGGGAGGDGYWYYFGGASYGGSYYGGAGGKGGAAFVMEVAGTLLVTGTGVISTLGQPGAFGSAGGAYGYYGTVGGYSGNGGAGADGTVYLRYIDLQSSGSINVGTGWLVQQPL